MSAVDATRVAPARITTAARLTRAWDHAGRVPRRTTVLAITTSVLLSTTIGTGLPVRVSAAVVGVVLASAALVDLHEHRLPNPLLAVGLVAVSFGTAVQSADAVLSALAGLFLAGVPMLVAHLRRGVGLGDVKAAAVAGASLGPVSVQAAPVAVAVAALVAAATGWCTGRRRMPLGPALWLGWAAAMWSTSMGWFR